MSRFVRPTVQNLQNIKVYCHSRWRKAALSHILDQKKGRVMRENSSKRISRELFFAFINRLTNLNLKRCFCGCFSGDVFLCLCCLLKNKNPPDCPTFSLFCHHWSPFQVCAWQPRVYLEFTVSSVTPFLPSSPPSSPPLLTLSGDTPHGCTNVGGGLRGGAEPIRAPGCYSCHALVQWEAEL